mgnify:CR=1 FL=1
MNKGKLLLKSVKFSVSLIYKSSGIWIAVYFFLTFIASALGLASTYALKYLLDILTVESILTQKVILCISIYIAVLLITQANQSIQNILYDTIFKKAEHLYDCNLAEKLSKLPLSVIDSSGGKDMVDDVRYAKNTAVYLTYRLVRIFSLVYTFVVAFTVLIVFNVWFSLFMLVMTVPGVILLLIYDKKAENLRRKQAPDVRKFCYYRWMLTDPWPAKDVRMYDLTKPIKSRYDEVKKEYLIANKRLDKKKLRSMLFSEIILRAGEILFTAFVIWKAVNAEIGIGDVALYVGLALSAVNAFEGFMNIGLMTYTRTTEVMSRVFDFFSIPTEGKAGARTIKAFESLEFLNVCFKYPYTDIDVLKGVTFTLNKGDKLSLVGINGSGKSTIIKLMLGLYEIESGEILINGCPMSEYDIRDVRKLFSALFQSFVQYPLTLRDNIALSDYDRATDDEAIIASLRQSGVYDELQEKLANGLDSYMTRRFDDEGMELSKGQWQKIALSRAYFKNAEIFIFDEPSAALDAEAEDRIFKNFESVSEGKTGIMISHRISAARMSNKILVLDGGVITESGTHDELIEKNGLYAKLYNLQKEKYTAKEEA